MCEKSIFIVANQLERAEKSLETATQQAQVCKKLMNTAEEICDKEGEGSKGDIEELAGTHSKINVAFAYFQENVTHAKELFKEDWLSGREGREVCHKMGKYEGEFLRFVILSALRLCLLHNGCYKTRCAMAVALRNLTPCDEKNYTVNIACQGIVTLVCLVGFSFQRRRQLLALGLCVRSMELLADFRRKQEHGKAEEWLADEGNTKFKHIRYGP